MSTYTCDGGRSFSQYEREMYPEQVAELERDTEVEDGCDDEE
jgi:hypothetical protein